MPSGINQADLARITRRLQRLPDDLKDAFAKELGGAAELVAAEARRRAPVLTGDLRDSIQVTQRGPLSWEVSAYAEARRGRGSRGQRLKYGEAFNIAWFMEFGTLRSAVFTITRSGRTKKIRRRVKFLKGGNARPFMLPAFRAVLRPILGRLRAAALQAIRRA